MLQGALTHECAKPRQNKTVMLGGDEQDSYSQTTQNARKDNKHK